MEQTDRLSTSCPEATQLIQIVFCFFFKGYVSRWFWSCSGHIKFYSHVGGVGVVDRDTPHREDVCVISSIQIELNIRAFLNVIFVCD